MPNDLLIKLNNIENMETLIEYISNNHDHEYEVKDKIKLDNFITNYKL